MPDKPKGSPAGWCLGGCLLFVVGCVLVFLSIYLYGRGAVTTLVEEQTDPAARERKAKELLGATQLPPGYYAAVGNISMGIVKSARLTDKPVVEKEAAIFNERGFVFNESIRSSTSKVDDFVDKKGNVLDEMGTQVRSDETLRDGTFEVNGQQIDYHVRRGEVTEGSDAVPGIFTVFRIKCTDNRDRWAVWFQKVPTSTQTSDIPMQGSVADEAAMKDFFSHFHICK